MTEQANIDKPRSFSELVQWLIVTAGINMNLPECRGERFVVWVEGRERMVRVIDSKDREAQSGG